MPSLMLGGFRNTAAADHAFRNGRSFPYWNLVSNLASPSRKGKGVSGLLAAGKQIAGTGRENQDVVEFCGNESTVGQASLISRTDAAGRIVPSCQPLAACAPKCTQNFGSQCRNWSKAPARCLRLWW